MVLRIAFLYLIFGELIMRFISYFTWNNKEKSYITCFKIYQRYLRVTVKKPVLARYIFQTYSSNVCLSNRP